MLTRVRQGVYFTHDLKPMSSRNGNFFEIASDLVVYFHDDTKGQGRKNPKRKGKDTNLKKMEKAHSK